MRVAVCHEWVTVFGGSEQVAARLVLATEATDLFTFVAEPALAEELFPSTRIHSLVTGMLGTLALHHWRWLLPLMPAAWRRVDFQDFDVVVTSAHACSNAIRVPSETLHVSYCHTPMRYAWEWRSELRRVPAIARPLLIALAPVLRAADRRWARRVDLFLANSHNVADRISRNYGRSSEVIHPPVDVNYWTPSDRSSGDYFLCAGRFVAYKRFEVAIEAAEAAGVRLIVAGEGPESARLRRAASRHTEFKLSPTREELRDLYRGARAFVFPGVEDFGMMLVEAQACGTPVIAQGRGGAIEAVRDGETGLLYDGDSAADLSRALTSFDPSAYNRAAVRRHAEGFGLDRFDDAIKAVVRDAVSV